MKRVSGMQSENKYINDNLILKLWIYDDDNFREEITHGLFVESFHQAQN